MIRCLHCGENLRDQARFCFRCGTEIVSGSFEKKLPMQELLTIADEPTVLIVPGGKIPPLPDPPITPTMAESSEIADVPTERILPPDPIILEPTTVAGNPFMVVSSLPGTDIPRETEQHGDPTLEPVLAAMEHLWWLLDERKDLDNRTLLRKARQEPSTLQLLKSLTIVGMYICRHSFLHYVQNTALPYNGLSDEQLKSAIVLVEFATLHARGDLALNAQKYSLLLKGIQGLRSGSLDAEAFVREWKTRIKAKAQTGPTASTWSELIALLVSYLAERRISNNLAPLEARKWAIVLATVSEISEADRVLFLTEAQLHGYSPAAPAGNKTEHIDPPLKGKIERIDPPVKVQSNGKGSSKEGKSEKIQEDPLGFLQTDQHRRLLDSIRSLRLDHVRIILRTTRRPLVSALSQALSDPSFDEIRPPRRSLRVWNFPDARMRILSPLEGDQKYALHLFEQAVKGTADRDNAAIAREWLLFAQARVSGLHKCIPLWREDYSKGIASWEEIWNLAVAFVRLNEVAQALEILKRGVKEQDSPFSHLRLALKCSVDILLHAENYSKNTVAMAVSFLLDNLTKLPLPTCYLAWLLLADEAQEPIDYNKQLYILGLFQDTLNRPIEILRPENQAEEFTIEDFEKDFQNLLAIIQRLENNYILEPQEDRIGIRSKMLATFLRSSQVVPRSVGLFVDYENLLPLLPLEMKMDSEGVGNILLQHASQFGNVVCRWACADPRKIPDPDGMSEGFKKAGFQVQFPRGETGILVAKENLTDFVLLERITFETTHSKPDIYIIVSGDKDYYEKIMGLLEEGNTVRLLASTSDKHLATKYKKLEQKSRRSQLPESYPGDFFIDNFDKLLQVKQSSI